LVNVLKANIRQKYESRFDQRHKKVLTFINSATMPRGLETQNEKENSVN